MNARLPFISRDAAHISSWKHSPTLQPLFSYVFCFTTGDDRFRLTATDRDRTRPNEANIHTMIQ